MKITQQEAEEKLRLIKERYEPGFCPLVGDLCNPTCINFVKAKAFHIDNLFPTETELGWAVNGNWCTFFSTSTNSQDQGKDP